MINKLDLGKKRNTTDWKKKFINYIYNKVYYLIFVTYKEISK